MDNSLVAYLNLGTSLIALGRCHEAALILREGSKLDGTGLRDRSAHNNAKISMLLQLGGLYGEQGKLQRALAVYREALHNLPANHPPQVNKEKKYSFWGYTEFCIPCGYLFLIGNLSSSRRHFGSATSMVRG